MSDAERPALTAVLDHYGVQYSPSKTTQMVRCPLQDEDRTPSCSLNLHRELWNCHSCGKGGDSYALIMEKEKIDFVRAKTFAASLGLAAGNAGGGDGGVSGSAYGGRCKVSAGQGDRKGRGGYVPAWRRG